MTIAARADLERQLTLLEEQRVKIEGLREAGKQASQRGDVVSLSARRKLYADIAAAGADELIMRLECARRAASLHAWCELAEDLCVVAAQAEDREGPHAEELWDVVEQIVAERDHARLAAT